MESRNPDIDGLVLPNWQAVLERNYSPWEEPHLIIDTANLTPNEAIALVEQHMNAWVFFPPISSIHAAGLVST